MKMKVLIAQSCPIFATPQTVACQAPLSIGFSRQEYWSGQPFPTLLQVIFLTQELNLGLLHCRQILYCLSHIIYIYGLSPVDPNVPLIPTFKLWEQVLRIELYLFEHLCYSRLFFISSTSNPTAITYILELLAFNCETKPETLGGQSMFS